MTNVGVRELKVHLSHYISLVRHGEEIMITKRGKPIARIVSEPRGPIRLQDELAALAVEGLVTLPGGQWKGSPSKLVKTKGKPIADLVLEDRR